MKKNTVAVVACALLLLVALGLWVGLSAQEKANTNEHYEALSPQELRDILTVLHLPTNLPVSGAHAIMLADGTDVDLLVRLVIRTDECDKVLAGNWVFTRRVAEAEFPWSYYATTMTLYRKERKDFADWRGTGEAFSPAASCPGLSAVVRTNQGQTELVLYARNIGRSHHRVVEEMSRGRRCDDPGWLIERLRVFDKRSGPTKEGRR
jgi:hypothetical protein